MFIQIVTTAIDGSASLMSRSHLFVVPRIWFRTPIVGFRTNVAITAMHAEEIAIGIAYTVRTSARPWKTSLARIAQIVPIKIEPTTTIAAYSNVMRMAFHMFLSLSAVM